MKILTIGAMVLLAGLLGACSDDDDDGGGGDVCEQAFNKQKDCAKDLDCTALTGMEQMACEMVKALSQMSYSQAQEACEQQTPGECDCTGAVKTSAEEMMACTLDSKTCSCPSSATPDGGPQPDQGQPVEDGAGGDT